MCALAVFLCGTQAFAQNAQLSGLVRDSSKASIPSASIEIENTGTHVKWQAKSNAEGFYLLPSLQPGTYQLTVQASGFEQQIIQNLKLEVAGKISVETTLRVGSENQSITVDGAGLQMNTIDAAVSTVVDQKFVENVPLNGRSLQSLLTMVPGVTAVPSNGVGYGGEMTVNGQRTEANYFTVDGVSANSGAGLSTPGYGAGYSGSVAGETALGTTQSIVPIDALQEFRATTSTYSAEYGRSPGGQFSFSTRSDTNGWHASIYDYFRNDALDANSWFNNFNHLNRTAERQNDFRGTLHGPVVIPGLYIGHDRSFFFFAYEGLRLQSPQPAVTSEVPSIALRESAASAVVKQLLNVNGFPLPTVNDRTDGLAHATLAYSLPSKLDNFSVRLDHHFNDRFAYRAGITAKPQLQNTGLFVQYEWKATSRMNLSRWDLNPAPKDAGGNQPYALTSTDLATMKLASRGTPLSESRHSIC